jgi:hypothetical protein
MGVVLFLCVNRPAFGHTATTHVPVTLHQASCPGVEDALGCYFEDPVGTYNVYWADGDVLTLYHELGHVYDATSLTDRYRLEFMDIMHVGHSLSDWRTWLINDSGATPNEWFAEAYGRCAIHMGTGLPTAYWYDPTRAQHRAICALIWHADRDRRI